MSLVMRKAVFAYAKTKTQISCAVTAQLISAFVFAIWILQSLFFLNPKFQASSYLLWLYSLVCIGPARKSRRPDFSERGSYINAAWSWWKGIWLQNSKWLVANAFSRFIFILICAKHWCLHLPNWTVWIGSDIVTPNLQLSMLKVSKFVISKEKQTAQITCWYRFPYHLT